MKPVATHPYYKVLREIVGFEQKIIEYRLLYLYRERIVTCYREFAVSDVFDMSYRKLGNAEGLLYLHTKFGIYSYTMKEEPTRFIEAFKELGG